MSHLIFKQHEKNNFLVLFQILKYKMWGRRRYLFMRKIQVLRINTTKSAYLSGFSGVSTMRVFSRFTK